jgi:hypothetical protein
MRRQMPDAFHDWQVRYRLVSDIVLPCRGSIAVYPWRNRNPFSDCVAINRTEVICEPAESQFAPTNHLL